MKLPGLRRVREEALLTQLELAAKSGVSMGSISRIENGYDTSARTTRKLAETLGVDHHDLIKEEVPA